MGFEAIFENCNKSIAKLPMDEEQVSKIAQKTQQDSMKGIHNSGYKVALGIEPRVEALQASALPLGYATETKVLC